MKKRMFKNVEILMTDRDESNIETMLKDPIHASLQISLTSIVESDNKGRITFFMPSEQIKWGLIFYFQNLMIRQRLHQMDEFLDAQKDSNE